MTTLKDLLRAWGWRGRSAPGESLREEPPPPPSRPSSVSAPYRPLYKYLEGRYAQALVLTFAEVEDLLGVPLPEGARLDPAWWTNPDPAIDPTPQSRSWIEAGRSAKANLPAQIVLFERR